MNKSDYVFELRKIILWTAAFWFEKLCSLVGSYQPFGGTYSLHNQC
jgi:hypothetical protein